MVTIAAADDQAGAADIGLLAGIGPRRIVASLALVLTGMLLIGGNGQVVAVLRYLLLGSWPSPSLGPGPARTAPAATRQPGSGAVAAQRRPGGRPGPCSAPR